MVKMLFKSFGQECFDHLCEYLHISIISILDLGTKCVCPEASRKVEHIFLLYLKNEALPSSALQVFSCLFLKKKTCSHEENERFFDAMLGWSYIREEIHSK